MSTSKQAHALSSLRPVVNPGSPPIRFYLDQQAAIAQRFRFLLPSGAVAVIDLWPEGRAVGVVVSIDDSLVHGFAGMASLEDREKVRSMILRHAAPIMKPLWK